ncbi:MAG TPA: T9SS type A sorting domain-containing protein [Saprospiraceae bacterium]|nr:T9SS type A sorting domain-containing protein [Saprospiraceae bacterium]
MKYINTHIITVCLTVIITSTPIFSKSLFSIDSCPNTSHISYYRLLDEFLNTIKLYNKYRTIYHGYEVANKIKNTYNDCLSNGYSKETCNKASDLCATYDLVSNYFPGFPAATFRRYGLFEAFKLNCGDGICFQCCFVPNSDCGGVCHSSFIGFPVINCNANYGAGTRDVGITLIVGGNPGDPCLFAPQTCQHVPICLIGLGQEKIDKINNDPNDIMKSEHAVEQRARHYTEKHLNNWSEFINNFSTGKSVSVGKEEIIKDLKLDDINDFITLRGSIYWKSFIDSLIVFDGNIKPFSILDSISNQHLVSPSMWNFLRQLGLANLLSSIPNLYNRLSYTGSKIWLENDLNLYLKKINYSDSLFYYTMHPLSYYFFKINPQLQDYRLLSVPLINEPIQNNIWMGDTLGSPPIYDIAISNSSNKINLKITVSNYGDQLNNNSILDGITYWGDGTISEFSINPKVDTLTIGHLFRKPGYYQSFTTIQNTTGLRGFKFLEIKSEQPTEIIINELPILNKITIDSAMVQTSVFTFIEKIGFNISTLVNNKKTLLGISSPKTIWNAANLYYDTLVAHNYNLFKIDNITIEPVQINSTNDFGYCFLTFNGISGSIYNPVTNLDTLIHLPFILDSIKLENENGEILNNSEFIKINPNGKITIQFAKESIDITKIIIPIDKKALKQNYIEPSTNITWAGKNKFFIETKPDFLQEYSKDPNEPGNNSNKTLKYINIYPNPTYGTIIIDFYPEIIDDVKKITIYNSIGIAIKEIFVPRNQGQLFLRIDDLPSGAYFVSVQSSNKLKVEKIIKI